MVTMPEKVSISVIIHPEIEKKNKQTIADTLREREIVAMMGRAEGNLLRLQYENPDLLDKLLSF